MIIELVMTGTGVRQISLNKIFIIKKHEFIELLPAEGGEIRAIR